MYLACSQIHGFKCSYRNNHQSSKRHRNHKYANPQKNSLNWKNYKLKGPFLSNKKGRLKNKSPLLTIRWSNNFSAEPSGINKHFKLHFYNHLLTSQQIIISRCTILLQKISNLTIDPYSVRNKKLLLRFIRVCWSYFFFILCFLDAHFML